MREDGRACGRTRWDRLRSAFRGAKEGSGGGFGGSAGAFGVGGGGAGMGGAIFGTDATILVTNSTFNSNSALAGARGGDLASGLGGAVFVRNGSLTVASSTLAGNTAATGGGAVFAVSDKADGDGFSAGTATVLLANSILADTKGTATDFATALSGGATTVTLAGSNNLIELLSTTASLPDGLIASTADPQLGPLQNNGGPTWTMALLPGSPAIGAGVALAEVTTDQRGLPRNAAPDIGAFETQVPTVTVTAEDAPYTAAPYAGASATVTGPYGEVPADAGTVTYEYTNTATQESSATAPTAAGSYTVVATFRGVGYREASSDPTPFTLEQARVSVSGQASMELPLLGTDGLQLTARASSDAGNPAGTFRFYTVDRGLPEVPLGTVTVEAGGTAVLDLSAADLARVLDDPTFVRTRNYTVGATFTPADPNFSPAFSRRLAILVVPAQVQGKVYADLNNNGKVDLGERGIAGVKITLTGTDDLGNAVSRVASTDANGAYVFSNLRPSKRGGYTVTQTQPAGWVDGKDTVGTRFSDRSDALLDDNDELAVNDVFTGLQLSSGGVAENFNFGERMRAAAPLGRGDTAGLTFWQSANGQKLITSLNGAASATQLGNWLATHFPNLFAPLAGQTNVQVAAYYRALFARTVGTAPKLDAQVLAAALSVYVTNLDLAGTTAAVYGFNVSDYGSGAKTVNVGTRGTAFGLVNHSTVSLMELLLAVDARSRKGLLFDRDGNGRISPAEAALRKTANDLFSTFIGQAVVQPPPRGGGLSLFGWNIVLWPWLR